MTTPTPTAADERDRINEEREQELAKASRKDWRLTTWANAFGVWYCEITTPAGWGNVGPHAMDRHIGALRARARRAIRSEIQCRQGAPVGPLRLEVDCVKSYGDGVLYAIIFKEV